MIHRNVGRTNPGFSALELIMVMAVSAIIMTSLFEIYNQVVRNMKKIDRFVTTDSQILTFENRLGKDLLGLSAIWFTQADFEKKLATKNASDGTQEKSSSGQQQEKKSSRYFYSSNKNNNLEMLTFVTTSALQSYGATQDRFVRVVYRLEKDPKHPGNLRLMRKEILTVSEYIDDDALKAGKFYELATNIASLEMTYQFIDVAELKKQQQAKSAQDGASAPAQENKEGKQVMRSAKEWKEEKKKKGKEQKNGQQNAQQDVPAGQNASAGQEEDLGGAVVPKIVEMKISFGLLDDPAKKEYKFAFYLASNIDKFPKAIVKSQAPTADIQEGQIS
jgi:prepilin-type N-terminal cleavage/methylation domain-containing protein